MVNNHRIHPGYFDYPALHLGESCVCWSEQRYSDPEAPEYWRLGEVLHLGWKALRRLFAKNRPLDYFCKGGGGCPSIVAH